MVCQRCRGLLVGDTFYDPSNTAGQRYNATRCINCGYMEDAVVRANRVCTAANKQGAPCGRVGNSDVECLNILQEEPVSIR